MPYRTDAELPNNEAWGEDFSIRHLVMPNHVECAAASSPETKQALRTQN